MKVLIVGSFVEPPFTAGEVNTILNWSKAIHSVGAYVRILSLSSIYSGYRKIYDLDFEYMKTNRPRFQSTLMDWFRLQKEILKKAEEHDIIHFAMGADGFSSAPMLTLLKTIRKKIINSYLSGLPDKKTFFNRVLLFDLLTVPSMRMFHSFLEMDKISKKLKMLPPCVDTSLFRPREKYAIREKLGLPQDRFLIFTSGHFRYGRNILPLIKIISELENKYKNVMLLIGWTGYGDINNVKDVFQTINKKEFVKIIRPTCSINLYYNASDIYILAAGANFVIEFPMSILEALSSGVPVIAFNVNAVPEIVKNNFNGYVVEYADFAEVKSKLAYLIKDPCLLKCFSLNARNYVLNKFSCEVIGHKIYDIYREVVSS
ncbi:MAG: glycosyltransferase family 4 protein [Candidatus Jordarchaeaceae archaeon]